MGEKGAIHTCHMIFYLFYLRTSLTNQVLLLELDQYMNGPIKLLQWQFIFENPMFD